jgi:CelD/BcsL family acetyltransferase involved in cellulose biosynthesis/GNAT superfamily N-acetyltransferase
MEGDEVLALLHNKAFCEAWDQLHAKCPWATAFQGLGFVSTWYRVYHGRYRPVILYELDSSGRLRGALPLAAASESDRVLPAGGRQAEYHAWLADPGDGDAFIENAMAELRHVLPRATMVFHYLPPMAPVAWAQRGAHWRKVCQLRPFRRPLMKVDDPARIDESLAKKSNRSRLNRLRKLGKLSFVRLRTSEDLRSVLDDIIAYCDLRQGAVHGSLPFQSDPLKKPFHLAMMDVPGLLHTTVMRVGAKVVAAHIGAVSGDVVHLGITAISPFEAEHSPGKLLMLLLGKMLSEEGFSTLDLTPGGDSYKDRFATHHDEVLELTVFPRPLHAATRVVADTLEATARRVMRLAGLEPARLKRLARELTPRKALLAPISLGKRILLWLYHNSEYRLYSYATSDAKNISPTEEIARDSLPSLLLRRGVAMSPSKRQFLSRALARLEQGAHVYTASDAALLKHSGWMRESQSEAFFPEVHQKFRFPPGTATFWDFYTEPEARGHGLYQATLRSMLHHAATFPGVRQVYIGVLANNRPSRHVIEKMGFRYECSLCERTLCGKKARWLRQNQGG